MKKNLILFLFLCLFLFGCTNIKDLSIEQIIQNGTKRTINVYNKYRKGYKYNLPSGMQVIDTLDYNEIIASSKYYYYLYVDVVSYNKKVIEKYNQNSISYKSLNINYQDKYGYLEINQKDNDKYLIEIMYNYAKIEVMVCLDDVKMAVTNALSILTSIKYNDIIISKLLVEENSQFKEYEFNIFETTSTKASEYLEAIEKNEYKETEVHDSDLIN